jgi:hypothetical protein
MDFRFLLDLDPQLISLGKTPLWGHKGGRIKTHDMGRGAIEAFKKIKRHSQMPLPWVCQMWWSPSFYMYMKA